MSDNDNNSWDRCGWLEQRPGSWQLIDTQHVGEGYLRAIDLARDVLLRPHESIRFDLLLQECQVFLDLIVEIARDEGDRRWAATAIATLVLDRARAECDE